MPTSQAEPGPLPSMPGIARHRRARRHLGQPSGPRTPTRARRGTGAPPRRPPGRAGSSASSTLGLVAPGRRGVAGEAAGMPEPDLPVLAVHRRARCTLPTSQKKPAVGVDDLHLLLRPDTASRIGVWSARARRGCGRRTSCRSPSSRSARAPARPATPMVPASASNGIPPAWPERIVAMASTCSCVARRR